MQLAQSRITPCLWFDTEAEQAAVFYCGIFPNAEIGEVARFTEVGFEHHGKPAGTAMTVPFTLDGQSFLALNGGPQFTFSEAVSFIINCENQAEVDHYWSALTDGGQEGRCGWLKDRFGLSWQVVPNNLPALMSSTDAESSQHVMAAFFQMTKIDIATLEAARDGAAEANGGATDGI